MEMGVSVVICCHNSAKRLPPTLAHLAAQQDCDGIPWEVIVVDNASQDNTADVAISLWPQNAPAPLRVVREERLGLTYARMRGFNEARYEIVSFIDDDNWVYPDWIKLGWEIMTQNPDVGACGGQGEAVFETEPPWWFEQFKGSYGVGHQVANNIDSAQEALTLWGTGFKRKSAWLQLVENGFKPLLVGRQGNRLLSGEDIEISLALRLAGWKLLYDPRLKFKHFLPAYRLNWNYLRRLVRGFGISNVRLDPYRFALDGEPKTLRQKLERTWQWQVLSGLIQFRRFRKTITKLLLRQPTEGNYYVLQLERHIGRLFELLRLRGLYNRWVKEIQNVPWRGIAQQVIKVARRQESP